jgi:hypothetical protein
MDSSRQQHGGVGCAWQLEVLLLLLLLLLLPGAADIELC